DAFRVSCKALRYVACCLTRRKAMFAGSWPKGARAFAYGARCPTRHGSGSAAAQKETTPEIKWRGSGGPVHAALSCEFRAEAEIREAALRVWHERCMLRIRRVIP